MKKYFLFPLIGILMSGYALSALAQSKGDWIVDAGWFHFVPQDSSLPLTVNAPGIRATQPGSGASVGSADTFGFTGTYFFTDHLAGEAVFGIPPKFNLTGVGTLAKLGKLGSAYEWSPALLLKYYFGQTQSRFRPFVGAGASYIWYTGIDLSPNVANGSFLINPAVGNALTGHTSAELESSLSPVLNAGFSYKFDKHWSASFSVSYLFLKTRAKLTTRSIIGPVVSETEVTINPVITYASLGYKF